MSEIVFVDTETISLNRDHRHLWEIALLGDDSEFVCYPTVPLEEADPMALKIGRFHERHPKQGVRTPREFRKAWEYATEGYLPRQRESWAREIVRRTDGKHLVGAVPSFDEQRLWDFCKAHGQTPTWHYHLIDVEALAAGFLRGLRTAAMETGADLEDGWGGKVMEDSAPSGLLPWDSSALSFGVGVDPADFDRHTALGDCRWAKAIYGEVMGA